MTKVKNNYYPNVERKAQNIHEAVYGLDTDVEVIMKSLNYIYRKEVNDIRNSFRRLYNEDMTECLVDSLWYDELETIERRIIPEPVSPLLLVLLGIFSYAYFMYLILSQ